MTTSKEEQKHTLAETIEKAADRFRAKVVALDNGCWQWTGSKNNRGYGSTALGNKTMLAHRFSYIYHVGFIAEGMTIDHLCNKRDCVNPEHLKQATQYDNNMRGSGVTAANKRKTHCLNGHDLADAQIIKRADGVRRNCTKCWAIYNERKKRHA